MKEIVLRDSVAVLTPRQVDVLRCAADGLCVRGTAARLGIGAETVKTHRSAVIRNMEAPTITAACIAAMRAGVI